jgi:hypothetical protein
MLGLPWLDDEQASLDFGTTRVFTMMDGTSLEIQTEDRRAKCVLMSSGKNHSSCARRAEAGDVALVVT